MILMTGTGAYTVTALKIIAISVPVIVIMRRFIDFRLTVVTVAPMAVIVGKRRITHGHMVDGPDHDPVLFHGSAAYFADCGILAVCAVVTAYLGLAYVTGLCVTLFSDNIGKIRYV